MDAGASSQFRGYLDELAQRVDDLGVVEACLSEERGSIPAQRMLDPLVAEAWARVKGWLAEPQLSGWTRAIEERQHLVQILQQGVHLQRSA